MADANTTRYGLVKPEVGASSDVWGSKLNNDFDDVDVLLGAITTTGTANAYVLTTGLSLAAYVSGQSFIIKPNFANTGAATINVDTLGAKDLTKNGTTALASGDLSTSQYYRIVYDGTRFVVVGTLSGVYQPLDATLTALAALSWSSGNALLQFTAADTVSLTLTPSVTSVTATTTSATSPAGTFVNTTDNASVRVLRLEGDRATPANADEIYESYFLSDSAGNQDEFARLIARAATVTSGAETGSFRFQLMTSGTLSTRLVLVPTALQSNADDTVSLGAAGTAFSDLFLASGGVINWNNGDVTVTHSTNALAFAGASSGYSFDAQVSAASVAATTAAVVAKNTTDAASVQALRIEGDRATPATSDVVYASWYLSNGSGTQFEYGRISTIITDATAGSEDGQLYFGVALSGTQTNRMLMAATTLSPISNDAMGLGFAGVGWSDLFLASGGVINFNNGGVTLTHDATNDRLVLAAGALKARPAISTDTGGTLTSASDNCIVDLATAPTINDGIHEAGSIIVLVNNTGSSMTITQDTGMTLRLHGTATTGNLTLAAYGIAPVQIDPVSNAEAIVTGDVT